ncbi:hypothetical protein [Mycolicibacter icosiumassiliensis]|uniref:hypothetical protein n=1 Tax=Mycolicibacter icosiumassiliensis TaxID=1792835 RepID=UPI000ABD8DA6|nr:hypothetical protein [Mycolicibacter icosiumassiliensis]
MTAPTVTRLTRLTPTEHTAVQIIRSLELNGPANWRTIRDCYVGSTHRAAMPDAMRRLIDGGHVISRVVPDRKYHLVVFERGTGLPDGIDPEVPEARRQGGWRRRRKLAPTPAARSRR